MDSETKSVRVKVAYAWKFKKKLIEVNSKMGETESVSENGERGTLKIEHHRVDEDTIKITGSSEGSGEEFILTLVRAK